MRSNLYNLTFWVTVVAIICVFLSLFVLQVRKNPLRWDEVDYFQCMENVIRLGLPIYYAGEVKIDPHLLVYLSSRQLGGQEFVFYRFKPETGILKETFFAIVGDTSRYTYGMWHPPLYIYLGSVFLRLVPLAPENSHLLRYFNLMFSIGIFIGILCLSREIYPSLYKPIFLFALLFYALNPLAVRGSVLVDYNATLGPGVAIWFVITYLYGVRKNSWWGLILSTIVMLFTSLGIATSLLLAIGLHSVLSILLDRRQKIGQAIGAIIIGIIFFVLLFYAFCRLFQLPFSQPFLHNFARAKSDKDFLSYRQIPLILEYLKWYTYEIGLPVMSIFAFLLLKPVLSKYHPQRFLLPTVIIVGLISHAALKANAYWFPKYILFLLPLLFVYIAGEGLTLLVTTSKSWRILFGAIALLLVITCAVHSLHWIQHPGGTLYDKGQEGIIAIAEALKVATTSDEVVLCPKDVGFFASRKFIQLFGAYLTEVNLVATRIQEANVRFIVAPRALLNTNTEMGKFLQNEFTLEYETGSFVLLRKR